MSKASPPAAPHLLLRFKGQLNKKSGGEVYICIAGMYKKEHGAALSRIISKPAAPEMKVQR
jgi:hypothetical protein